MWTLSSLLNPSLPYTCIGKIEAEILNHTKCWTLMHVGKSLTVAKYTTEMPC